MSKATASMCPSTAGRFSSLLKKTNMLRCARSPRSNVPVKYAVARRFFARLASEIFLSSLQFRFFRTLKVRFDAELILFLLVLAPALSTAQSPPKVSVAYAAISPIFAGVWMAKEIGAFEKHGLKSELVYISSGSITVQAMVGGNLDMSVAASNAVVSSILRGAPLVAVGSITNRPAMSLFVQPDISRPEQLQGKALAITRHGSSTHFLTLFVLEKLGLKDKVKIQPMGGTREVDTAVRTGMVAGAVRSMKPGPKTRMLVDLPDLGIPFSMDLIAVKREFAKNSPRSVEAMLKAYIEGVAALRTRKEFAYKVLSKYLLGGESLDEAYEYAVKYLDREAKVDPAVIQTVLNWENKGETSVNDFFDNSIIDRIIKEGFVDRLYK
jgi:ABC-type nitrate/sulfonate/bicarbonate transport system substrate-binding protein